MSTLSKWFSHPAGWLAVMLIGIALVFADHLFAIGGTDTGWLAWVGYGLVALCIIVLAIVLKPWNTK